MKYIFLFIILYTLGSFTKPPKEPKAPTPPKPTAYSVHLNKLKDTIAYRLYLDSLVHSKDFCFREDTTGTFSEKQLDSAAGYPERNLSFAQILANEYSIPGFRS